MSNGQLGRGCCVGVGRVEDDNTPRCCGRDVDIDNADTRPANNFEFVGRRDNWLCTPVFDRTNSAS